MWVLNHKHIIMVSQLHCATPRKSFNSSSTMSLNRIISLTNSTDVKFSLTMMININDDSQSHPPKNSLHAFNHRSRRFQKKKTTSSTHPQSLVHCSINNRYLGEIRQTFLTTSTSFTKTNSSIGCS